MTRTVEFIEVDTLMTLDEIFATIRELACSQGFYGRLWHEICNMKENDSVAYRNFCDYIASANLRTKLDVVLFFES